MMDNNENRSNPENLVTDQTSLQTRVSLSMLESAIASKPRARRAPVDLSRLAQQVAGKQLGADTGAPAQTYTERNEQPEHPSENSQSEIILDLDGFEDEDAIQEVEEADSIVSPFTQYDETGFDSIPVFRDGREINRPEGAQAAGYLTSETHNVTAESEEKEEEMQESSPTQGNEWQAGAEHNRTLSEYDNIKAMFGEQTVMLRLSDPMEYHRLTSKAVNDEYAVPDYDNGELVFKMTSKAANVIRNSETKGLFEMEDAKRELREKMKQMEDEFRRLEAKSAEVRSYLDKLPQ